MKSLLRAAVIGLPVLKWWNFVHAPSPCIINFHRFDVPGEEMDPFGMALSADVLRLQLAALRRNGYSVVPLLDLIEECAAGDLGGRRVALTVDDGYEDFDRVGAPVFAEFDCPATVFLVSGFLDGTTWCWWDFLTEVFLRTPRNELTHDVAGVAYTWRLTSRPERLDASARLNLVLERVPDVEKWATIHALAVLGEVDVPSRPLPWCRPMSWEAARAWQSRGMQFAPHTVTHPILKQTDAAQCRAEIEGSWHRVREELPDAVPLFAYPNGKDYAVGLREANIVAETGMSAAVTTERRRIATADFERSGAMSRYLLPRHSSSDSVPGLLQAVAGVEDVRARWRRRRT